MNNKTVNVDARHSYPHKVFQKLLTSRDLVF